MKSAGSNSAASISYKFARQRLNEFVRKTIKYPLLSVLRHGPRLAEEHAFNVSIESLLPPNPQVRKKASEAFKGFLAASSLMHTEEGMHEHTVTRRTMQLREQGVKSAGAHFSELQDVLGSQKAAEAFLDKYRAVRHDLLFHLDGRAEKFRAKVQALRFGQNRRVNCSATKEQIPVNANPSRLENVFILKWRIASRTAVYICREYTTKFTSRIRLSNEVFDDLDGKSLMDWLIMRTQPGRKTTRSDGSTIDVLGPEVDTRIRIVVRGTDAVEAMGALSELLTVGERIDKCVEPGCPSPPWLARLRPEAIEYACSHGHHWEVARNTSSDNSRTIVSHT